MGTIPRANAGGIAYHVLNRANERAQIFASPGDFDAFEEVLTEAKQRTPLELFSYVIMPNHWHMVLRPSRDGDLSVFMHWLTLAHSKRWRTFRDSVGSGHLYQGPFKSFPVQDDRYFLTVCRYVERNPIRAKLVDRAEAWRWSSAWRRQYGSMAQRQLIDRWPMQPTANVLLWINEAQSQEEIESIRGSVKRGRPYGDVQWTKDVAERLGLEATLQPLGRPKRNLVSFS